MTGLNPCCFAMMIHLFILLYWVHFLVGCILEGIDQESKPSLSSIKCWPLLKALLEKRIVSLEGACIKEQG